MSEDDVKIAPETPNQNASEESEAEKRIDRLADEAATRAQKTEEKYDTNHDIFSK